MNLGASWGANRGHKFGFLVHAHTRLLLGRKNHRADDFLGFGTID